MKDFGKNPSFGHSSSTTKISKGFHCLKLTIMYRVGSVSSPRGYPEPIFRYTAFLSQHQLHLLLQKALVGGFVWCKTQLATTPISHSFLLAKTMRCRNKADSLFVRENHVVVVVCFLRVQSVFFLLSFPGSLVIESRAQTERLVSFHTAGWMTREHWESVCCTSICNRGTRRPPGCLEHMQIT